MKCYPEYKESSVEWIGEIPKHWKILPFMHCLKKVKTPKKTSIPKMDYQKSGKFPIVDQGASFIAGWTDLTDSVISDNLPVVIFGDHTRIFKYVDFPFTLGADGTQLLYPNDDVLNPRFFYYALLNLRIPNQGYSRHYRYLRKFSVACPSLPTQTQIANFLDRKTEQIDELIRIKELRIELLHEQRTALINQAVTKGLDPKVEMKPSGVEWIGEIPKHWQTTPIKYTLQTAKDSIRAGPFGSSLKSHEFQDKGIRVYNQQSVYNEDFSKSDVFISEEKFNELRSFIVQPKDVLVTSRGTIGKMTIVPKNGEIGVLHPCLIRLKLNENKLVPKYLWWYVNHSSFFIESVKIASNSTTIEVIYTETLSSVKIPIPTVKEQLAILEFLNVKIPIIDTTISNEQKKIKLLKEYRQSLISEAVTGKIDVRNGV